MTNISPNNHSSNVRISLMPQTHTKRIFFFLLCLLSLYSKKANMENELVTKSLFVKQERENISNSNNHGGSDIGNSSSASAAVRPSDSSATVILVTSTFVVACSSFAGKFIIKYSQILRNGIPFSYIHEYVNSTMKVKEASTIFRAL